MKRAATVIYLSWLQQVFIRLVLVTAVALVAACDGGGGSDPDEDGIGGVVGTGIILRGTVSDPQRLATSEIRVKSLSGERSLVGINAQSGRYEVEAFGESPFVVRTSVGENQHRYSIGYGGKGVNVHSYSDLILRSWFARQNRNIDEEFELQSGFGTLPDEQSFLALASELFSTVSLLFTAYELTGGDLLNTSFDADGTGIDAFLLRNPVVLDGNRVSYVQTDPMTDTQSVTLSSLTLDADLMLADTTVPATPGGVRVLPSAVDQIVIVWNPTADNTAVIGYQIYRDGVLIATTPFPVFTDTALTSGTPYRYEIVALDAAANQSDRSAAVTGFTLDGLDEQPPPVPTMVTSLGTDGDRIQLIWGQSNIADVAAFNVYRRSGSGAVALLVKVTSTPFTDISVLANQTYCYRVSALDASNNESALSEELCVDLGTPVQSGQTVPPLAGLTIRDTDNISCSGQLETTDLGSNTSLPAGCYTIAENLQVPEFANLTLEPGVTLKFAEGVKLSVGPRSSLTARGTAGNPVIMTGMQSIRGYWGGVEFDRSNNPSNLVKNTVIQYAGGGDLSAALLFRSSSNQPGRIRIENSLVRLNSNYGLSFPGNDAIVESFYGNLITGNRKPAFVQLEVLESLGYGNDFSGNDIDTIDMSRNSYRNRKVVPNMGIRILSNGLTMSGGLTIEAGAELAFLGGSILDITGDLIALGTSELPILLTAIDEQRGEWRGVHIDDSNESRLEHVTVEYAGESSDERPAAGLVINDTRLFLSDVSLSDNLNYGLYVQDEQSRLNQFDNVTLTDYYLNGSYTVEQGSLTLDPGVSILAGPTTEIFIARTAFLKAVGESSRVISIEGESAVPGFWGGVIIASPDSNNQLAHVTVSHAGGASKNSTDPERRGMIRMQCTADFTAMLSVTDTDLLDGDSWGIYLDENGCTLTIGDNVRYAGHRLGSINRQ